MLRTQKRKKAQLSAEMILLAAIIVTIVAIVAVKLISTTKHTTHAYVNRTNKVLDNTSFSAITPPKHYEKNMCVPSGSCA